VGERYILYREKGKKMLPRKKNIMAENVLSQSIKIKLSSHKYQKKTQHFVVVNR